MCKKSVPIDEFTEHVALFHPGTEGDQKNG
jgi:hypothetical protein